MKKTLLSISISAFLFNICMLFPFFLVPLYAGRLGLQIWQISLLTAVYWLMYTLTTTLWGTLSDIFDRKKPFVVAALLGTALVFFMTAFVSDTLLLAMMMAFAGMASAAFSPAILAMVTDISTEEEKGENMGILNTLISLGWTTGTLAGGFIIEIYSFSASFYFGATIALIGAIFSIFFLKPTRKALKMKYSLREVFSAVRHRFLPTGNEISFLKKNGLNWLYIFTFLRYTAIFGIYPLFTIYFVTLGATETWLGIIFAVNPFAQIFLMTPAGKLSDKIGRKPTILFGFFGSALFLIFTSTVGMIASGSPIVPFFFLIPVMLLLAITYACISTGTNAFIADIAPEDKRGEAMGLLTSSIGFGGFVGGLISGFLAEALNFQLTLLILAILPLSGFLGLFKKMEDTR